jgi:hypothetical protein
MQSGSDAPVVLLVDEAGPETETFTLDRSHSLPRESVSNEILLRETLCNRGLWLHHGRVVRDGAYQEVAAAYTAFMSEADRHLWDHLPASPVPAQGD